MPFSIHSTRKISVSIALAVFLLYYSILFAFPNYLLADPDTFWHIRFGQWVLDHAQFPTVDFFSYTAAGKPWIATEWLSEVFFCRRIQIRRLACCSFSCRPRLFCGHCHIVFLPGATASIFRCDRLDCANGSSR